MAGKSLPPGFRFYPTDEELVTYYLDRKVTGSTIELDVIPEVDIYKCEPWDLPEKSLLASKDMEWYFYSPTGKKYPNGSRTNRATRGGYWKATGKDRLVKSLKRAVGMKKTLVYYKGRAPNGIRTNWVMHEYRLIHSLISSTPLSTLKEDSYALCRVFKKTLQSVHPKTNEGKTGNPDKETLKVQQPLHDLLENNPGGDGNVININNEDTSSSDVTQGTSFTNYVDDHHMQVPFSSDTLLEKDMQMPDYSGFHNYNDQLQYYPALEMDDFPQIDITKPSKYQAIDHYNMTNYDNMNKYKEGINGTLEEILSLCASHQDNNSANNISSSILDY